MHREQHKCSLRRMPLMSRGAHAGAEADADFSGFSANLHSARLNLLPHMVFTAVVDACRGVTAGVKSSLPSSTSSAAVPARAIRR